MWGVINDERKIRRTSKEINVWNGYKTLLSEFDVILKQMDLIDKISDIDTVSPMTYPFDLELDDTYLREDIPSNEICFDDMKVNVKDYDSGMVKVPKVVE